MTEKAAADRALLKKIFTCLCRYVKDSRTADLQSAGGFTYGKLNSVTVINEISYLFNPRIWVRHAL